MKMIRSLIFLLFLFSSSLVCAANDEKTLNIYIWSNVVPDSTIQQFEKETGIKVNFSTYDSNEIMYAKLKTTQNAGYDIVEPSTYYIDRMYRQEMLEKIDKSKLSNFHHLNPDLLNQSYDPKNRYSVPFMWGVTGIFVNKDQFAPNSITRWSTLWDKKYQNQLLMLDDTREVFSMALLVLGYSVNDSNPEHIKQAYLKLKEIYPNVKIKRNATISILIDEDATLGMAWNGDVYRARQENANLTFVYPRDGFVIWVDSFVIPKHAPHQNNAYKFLNFILRPDVARAIVLETNFPTANLSAQKLLPKKMQDDPMIYPAKNILSRGEIQMDIGDEALALYEKYWERLKMGG